MTRPGTLVIVQARSTSSRLPKKHAVRFGGVSALEHVVLRSRSAVLRTLVATPASDRAVRAHCLSHDLPCFAYDGPEDDVLGRFRAAAAHYGPEIVVRLTADCPFVQPYHIQAAVSLAKLHGFAALGPQTGFPDGLDVEAFRTEWLDVFHDREHVTRGVCPVVTITSPVDLSRHRWTLDTRADLKWLKHICTVVNCAPPFAPTMKDLLAAIATDEDTHGHFA